MAYETMLAATAVLISLTPLGAKAQDSTHRSVKAISGHSTERSFYPKARLLGFAAAGASCCHAPF
jgi:hypothetical protein